MLLLLLLTLEGPVGDMEDLRDGTANKLVPPSIVVTNVLVVFAVPSISVLEVELFIASSCEPTASNGSSSVE